MRSVSSNRLSCPVLPLIKGHFLYNNGLSSPFSQEKGREKGGELNTAVIIKKGIGHRLGSLSLPCAAQRHRSVNESGSPVYGRYVSLIYYFLLSPL